MLLWTNTKSSARGGVSLFLSRLSINPYVLQLLSHEEEDAGCPSNFSANDFSSGVL
jgi:hypothetical protein